jgi:coproporphyrinogen dehydrogenase
VIKALICNFKLEFDRLEQAYDIDFNAYFAEDLTYLEPLAKDGLLEINEKSISVSPRGRLLIRNICLCFDVYSRQLAKRQQFSRII